MTHVVDSSGPMQERRLEAPKRRFALALAAIEAVIDRALASEKYPPGDTWRGPCDRAFAARRRALRKLEGCVSAPTPVRGDLPTASTTAFFRSPHALTCLDDASCYFAQGTKGCVGTHDAGRRGQPETGRPQGGRGHRVGGRVAQLVGLRLWRGHTWRRPAAPSRHRVIQEGRVARFSG
jgi:hypothetical protein